MKKRDRRLPQHDAHEGADRWLLTYADLITLLLGLFVILYTMSKIDNTKFSKVIQAFGGVFGKGATVNGGNALVPGQIGIDERLNIQSKIRGAMYDDLKSNLISISEDERGVVVHLAEELLFASGSATLKTTSLSSMDLLASVLKTLPNEVRIEGHTDDVPIKTTAYPSNWQLSVARAMNTGDYLLERHGLNPERVSIVGYSQYKPLVPNSSGESRAKNRRVDIVILATRITQHRPGQESQQ